MKTTHVNEVQILYKPNLNLENSLRLISAKNANEFLKTIWEDDIEYRERFYVVYLNRNSNILGYNLISMGGSSATVVDIKMVLQPAILLHASSIILAHNHPSGNLNPSDSDKLLTRKIIEAGRFLDIPVYDHIIITKDSYFSFMDEGIM